MESLKDGKRMDDSKTMSIDVSVTCEEMPKIVLDEVFVLCGKASFDADGVARFRHARSVNEYIEDLSILFCCGKLDLIEPEMEDCEADGGRVEKWDGCGNERREVSQLRSCAGKGDP